MKRLASIAALLALIGGLSGQGWCQSTDAVRLHKLLLVIARLHGLDPALLEAIARVESGMHDRAVSPAGAQGLMQLMPATARRFGVADPFDPVDNVIGAARFVDSLRQWQQTEEDFEVHLPQLIAAYNAGPEAVRKYRGIPPYAETRDYVRRVLFEYFFGELPPSDKDLMAADMPRPVSARVSRVRRTAESDARLLGQLSELRQEREQHVSVGGQTP